MKATLSLAVVFLALHLAFLPASLEDLDSFNFALGLRHFDVASHQPHPPGYPVYIAVGKLFVALIPDEAKALGLMSGVAGALGVLALVGLFAHLDVTWPRRRVLAATLVAATSPLYWFTAARPLSDLPGLAAATSVQALLLAATSAGGLVRASFLAGLAMGIRSQVAWLTLPLLIVLVARHRTSDRTRLYASTLAAIAAGVLVWAIPLVLVTGGPGAYWRALSAQGAEDLAGIQMLWTTPTVRQLLLALYFAFVAPWAAWPFAAAVLVTAGFGLLRMFRTDRPALLVLVAAFGPYLVFDLLFQETFTSRYALPLVAPIAYLAVRAASTLPKNAGLILAIGAAGFGGSVGAISVASYASMPAPAVRLMADMRAAARIRRTGVPPVLAMDRREGLDLRRPILWSGSDMPSFSRQLAAPPKHEWLELVKYWNAGGRDPVWFVADPLRTDVALIDHQAGRADVIGSAGRHAVYRWPLDYPVLLGGVRPNEMDWHIFDSPGWYLGQGWALTPETAGVAEEDHRGPGLAPIDGWIRRRPEPVTLMIGGRNLGLAGAPARVTVAVGDRMIDEAAVPPGFFLKFVRLPEGALEGDGRYVRIAVAADRPRVAIGQFDAQSAGQVVFGFGEGWHELEYTPATGRLWHWMSERGVIRAHAEGHPLRLTMTGVTEGFSRQTRVTIRVGDRVLAQSTVGARFTLEAEIPVDALGGAETPIAIETDQFFVPAERSRRTRDRRHLALRVYDVQLRPAS